MKKTTVAIGVLALARCLALAGQKAVPVPVVMADAASFNQKAHLVWIGLGAAEPSPFPGSIKAFCGSLEKGGSTCVYFESPATAHEWLTWRLDLNDFAPRLFRQ